MTLSVRFIVETPAVYQENEDGFKYLAVFSDGTCWGMDELTTDMANSLVYKADTGDTGWAMEPLEWALLPQGTVVWADTDGVDLVQFMQDAEQRGAYQIAK